MTHSSRYPDPARIRRYRQRAVAALRDGNAALAATIIDEVAAMNGGAVPKDMLALAALATAAAGRTLAAQSHLRAIASLGQADTETHYHAAVAACLAGDRPAALHHIRCACAQNPHHAGVRQLRAWLGTRRRVAVPALDRNHPINRWIGWIRARLTRQHRPEPPALLALLLQQEGPRMHRT